MTALRKRPRSSRRKPFYGSISAGGILRPVFFGNPLYSLTLIAGSRVKAVLVTPPNPWPGNAVTGNALLQGEFPFSGKKVFHHGLQGVDSLASLWSSDGKEIDWLEELHGFEWINDLHVIGSDAARRLARILVSDWIARHGAWRSTVWRSDILGSRISAWLSRFDFFCASADEDFRSKFFASLSRQVKHLHRIAAADASGAGKILALKGLIYAGVCLPGGRKHLAKGLRLLVHEIDRQVFPDGGHFERNPEIHLCVLRNLIDIRATLIAGRHEVPAELQSAIDRMAPMLRFFRHGDGALALFNGSSESTSWLVDMVLSRADAKGKPFTAAPHTGFQRLNVNRSLVLLDSGARTPAAPDLHMHAGTLSFEMSVGKERLIVNCGTYLGEDSSWGKAMRATAAHSTLVIEDTNSSEILGNGHLGRQPSEVTCRRDEEAGNIWIDARHDGFELPFGLTHRRRLFMAAKGEDFRGEDTLIETAESNKSDAPLRYTLCFHLHPGVRASLLHNRSSVLLRLPSGQGWRLRASGGEIGISESIYLGKPDDLRRCERVTISGVLGTGGTGGGDKTDQSDGEINGEKARGSIKWAFTRVSEKT